MSLPTQHLDPDTMLTCKVLPTMRPVPLFDTYVDRYMTAIVGTSAIALARLVATEDGNTWSALDLTMALGAGRSVRRLEQVIARAGHFLLARQSGLDLCAMDHVPLLRPTHLHKLPERLQVALDGRVA